MRLGPGVLRVAVCGQAPYEATSVKAEDGLKVAIISHVYLTRENRKNVVELAKHADVNVVSPDRALYDVFSGSIDLPAANETCLFSLYPLKRISGPVYFLHSGSLSFDRFGPDIVHVEYDPWSAIFWQALYCRARYAKEAKLVITVKKNTYRRYAGPAGWVKHAIAKIGGRRVDRIIAASKKTADLYVRTFGVPRRKITVIHHLGTDVSLFAPEPGRRRKREGESLVVGYCGRLEAHKGILDLLAAVEQCRAATGANLTLKCLGEGRLWERLQAHARQTKWFHVLPTVLSAGVADFLKETDIFVLPSRVLPDHEEHDAHALLEALATGVASIGARSGIIPEILGDGSGLLVEPGSPDSLAAALSTLAGDEILRDSLGRRGRKKAIESFSLEAIARRKIQVYEDALHDR